MNHVETNDLWAGPVLVKEDVKSLAYVGAQVLHVIALCVDSVAERRGCVATVHLILANHEDDLGICARWHMRVLSRPNNQCASPHLSTLTSPIVQTWMGSHGFVVRVWPHA